MTSLIVLPTYGFHDEDLLNLIKILDEENVYISTMNKQIAIGKNGTKVIPDFSLKDIVHLISNPFDKIIIIADDGWKELDNLDVKTLVAGFMIPNKKIIAISLAPFLLARFGFLTGKIATYNLEDFPEYQKLFLRYGVKITNFPVFKDKNIITCKGRDSIFLLKNYII